VRAPSYFQRVAGVSAGMPVLTARRVVGPVGLASVSEPAARAVELRASKLETRSAAPAAEGRSQNAEKAVAFRTSSLEARLDRSEREAPTAAARPPHSGTVAPPSSQLHSASTAQRSDPIIQQPGNPIASSKPAKLETAPRPSNPTPTSKAANLETPPQASDPVAASQPRNREIPAEPSKPVAISRPRNRETSPQPGDNTVHIAKIEVRVNKPQPPQPPVILAAPQPAAKPSTPLARGFSSPIGLRQG